jgi:hypothetical protein
LTISDRPPKEKIDIFDRFILNFWRAPSVQTVAFLAGYIEDPSSAHDRADSDILHAADMQIATLSQSCTALTSEKNSLAMVNAKLNRTIQSRKKYGSTPLKHWYPNIIRQSKKWEIDM